jgi:hypothetical protein
MRTSITSRQGSLRLRHAVRSVLLGSAIGLLAACGGGGSGSSAPGPQPGGPQPGGPQPGGPQPSSSNLPQSVSQAGPNASLFVDVTGNTVLDLVAGSPDGDQGMDHDWLLINNGSGVFSVAASPLPNRYLGRNGTTVAIAAIDANLNGRNDLLLVTVDARQGSYYETSRLQLFLNQGNGQFTDASDQINGGDLQHWPEWVRVADYDGDGYPDILLTSSGSGPNAESCEVMGGRIFLNDGTGQFTQADITLEDGFGSYSAECLIVDRYGNSEPGMFTSSDRDRHVLDALVADIDGDGRPDIVASTMHTYWPVFINRSLPGALHFEVVFNGPDTVTVEHEGQMHDLVGAFWKNGTLADINGNGNLDLVGSAAIATGPQVAEPVLIWHGQGDGTFFFAGGAGADDCSVDALETVLCRSYFVDQYPDRTGVAHARQWLTLDIDGDGLDDVYIADHGWDAMPFPGRRNILLRGQSDGSMIDASSEWLSTASTFTHGAAVGDITGNSRPDLFKNNYWDAGGPGAVFEFENGAKLWFNDATPPLRGED